MENYTPVIGRRLNIKVRAALCYSLALLGLGVFILVRYNIYSTSDYPNCQFGHFKTNIYIISVANLICGLLIGSASILQLNAIKEWVGGNINTQDFWQHYYREYNRILGLILFLLQISVIGFITSNEFRVFNPSECDPYVYYILLINVDVLYNILLIGVAVYLGVYLVFGVLYGLWMITQEFYELCCLDIRLSNFGFGMFGRGRTSTSDILPITNQIVIQIPDTQPSDSQQQHQQIIPEIIPENVQFIKSYECIVCIKKTDGKLSNGLKGVCKNCVSQLRFD